MTFTRIFELYRDCSTGKATDSTLFRLSDYGVALFNTALNTTYFNRQMNCIEVTRGYAATGLLVVTFHIANMTVTLRDAGEDAVQSYKAHTLELMLAWLTQVAGLLRVLPFAQAIMCTRNMAITSVPMFDAYAFRQLLKQDFDNPRDYYVCHLKYTSLFFNPAHNPALVTALSATSQYLLDHYDGTPEMAWKVFLQNCVARNIANEFKLTADDRQSISKWLYNCFDPYYTHGEDNYEYKTSILKGYLDDPIYKLWGKFCASTAKRIIQPRCNGAFKTQC